LADLFIKLLLILHLPDPGAERHFYERLGLRTTYEGREYPGFIAVGNDAVAFGLSRSTGADPAAYLAAGRPGRRRGHRRLPGGGAQLRGKRGAAARGLGLPDREGSVT
jgi:hypothetical protein